MVAKVVNFHILEIVGKYFIQKMDTLVYKFNLCKDICNNSGVNLVG